jgi:hypothetical protein
MRPDSRRSVAGSADPQALAAGERGTFPRSVFAGLAVEGEAFERAAATGADVEGPPGAHTHVLTDGREVDLAGLLG